MEMEKPYYIHDGKFWIPAPTGSGNDNLLHAIFGSRRNEDEPYKAESVLRIRRHLENYLTFFENEPMPSGLIDILRKCFLANEKYKHASVEDQDQLENYASEINEGRAIRLEELPFLAAHENVKIVLFSKNGCDVIEPDLDLLGPILRRYFDEGRGNAKIEAVVSLEGSTFCKLVIADEKLLEQYLVDYLVPYWMDKLNLEASSRNKCERYAKTLLNRMSSWIQTGNHFENDFTDVTLQRTMLAETFQQNNNSEWEGCKEYLETDEEEPKLPEKISSVKLCDMIMEKKRDIFMDTENVIGENQTLAEKFEECLASHRILALETVLDKAKCGLFASYQRESENFEPNLLKFGIVKKSDDKFHFIHDIFKEYFFADSLLKELLNRNEKAAFQRFLFEEIISCREFKITRVFVESHLQTASLPSNIFRNYQSLKHDIDFEKQNSLQCTIHLLAKEGCLATLKLLLKCIDYRPVTGESIKIANISEATFDNDSWKRIFGNSLNVLRYLTRRGGVNIGDERDNTPLYYAAEKGHLEMVKFLVEQGASVDESCSEFQTALHVSALGGYLDIVKFLVERNANIEIGSKNGTALHLAISGGSFDIAKFLIESGDKMREINSELYTAIHLAAKQGRLDIVKLIVEHGGDVDIRRNNDPTALHVALLENHMDVAEYLVDRGADINSRHCLRSNAYSVDDIAEYFMDRMKCPLLTKDVYTRCCAPLKKYTDWNGFTALHLAVSTKDLEAVKFLLQRGANVDVKNARGDAPLHLSLSRNVEFCKRLSEHGADLNVTNIDGYTVLHLAIENDLRDVAEYLLARGANTDVINKEGYTALHFAVRENDLGAVKLLVRRGADVNARDRDGDTALRFSVSKNYLDIFKFLVENGANVNIRDKINRTVLHLAAKLGKLKFVTALAGCDINILGEFGRTALHEAAYNDHLDVVKYLVRKGATVNIQDFNKCPPLYSAIARDNLNIVKFLLQNGSRTDFKYREGCDTALQFAASKCSLQSFKYFTEHDPDSGSGGANILLLASEKVRPSTGRFLTECGVDINTTQDDGRTILHLFAKKNYSDIVEFLVDAGMDVNARDGEGRTPLHLAAKKDRLHIVEFLIKRVRDVNERDVEGRTPLHLAAVKHKLNAVRALVETGADVTIRDNDGLTALHLATLWRPLSTDLARYLEPRNRTQKRRLSD